MKKILSYVIGALSLGFVASVFATSPVGYWQTIDDVTGKPKGIVQITESSQKALTGQILKIFPAPGHSEKEVCSECTGERHNQPIVGMVVLENLVQDKKNPDEWSGGTILDPKNGKIYKCYIQVKNNGDLLNVRGYIGLSMFGRTQVWHRVNSPTG